MTDPVALSEQVFEFAPGLVAVAPESIPRLDDVGLTMVKKDKIASYEEKAAAARPWM